MPPPQVSTPSTAASRNENVRINNQKRAGNYSKNVQTATKYSGKIFKRIIVNIARFVEKGSSFCEV